MLVGGNKTIDGVLTNVLHVPGLAKNLFSVTKATTLGNIFEFGKKRCVIMNKQKKVIQLGLERKWSISVIM